VHQLCSAPAKHASRLGSNDDFLTGSCQIAYSGPGDEFGEIHALDVTSPPELEQDANPFVSPEPSAGNPSDKDLQRAEGSCRIVLSGSEKGTRVMDIFQRSPIASCFQGREALRSKKPFS